MKRGLEIAALGPEEGDKLSKFLSRQPEAYRKDFHPFANESPEYLSAFLRSHAKDRFRVVTFEESWVAMYMLRGWSEGYERPSFGVIVDHSYSGNGIGKICLLSALAECRLLNVRQVMLKVAGTNYGAAALYEKMGFSKDSVCESTGHNIMTIRL